MAEEKETGWRIVEGPSSESTNEDVVPEDHDLGKEGYEPGSTEVDGEPGPTGPALGEIPEHTRPLPIEGIDELFPSEEETE